MKHWKEESWAQDSIFCALFQHLLVSFWHILCLWRILFAGVYTFPVLYPFRLLQMRYRSFNRTKCLYRAIAANYRIRCRWTSTLIHHRLSSKPQIHHRLSSMINFKTKTGNAHHLKQIYNFLCVCKSNIFSFFQCQKFKVSKLKIVTTRK